MVYKIARVAPHLSCYAKGTRGAVHATREGDIHATGSYMLYIRLRARRCISPSMPKGRAVLCVQPEKEILMSIDSCLRFIRLRAWRRISPAMPKGPAMLCVQPEREISMSNSSCVRYKQLHNGQCSLVVCQRGPRCYACNPRRRY